MANTLTCDIVSPDSLLYSGKAVLVSAPAADGDIGLMYQCSPLMSTLRRGVIRIKDENDEVTTFVVNGGYLEVDGYKVIVLASRAINIKDIERSISEERIARYEARLAELDEDSSATAYAKGEISWQEYLITLL